MGLSLFKLQEFSAAIPQLEPLLNTGDSSQETERALIESYLRIGNLEKADELIKLVDHNNSENEYFLEYMNNIRYFYAASQGDIADFLTHLEKHSAVSTGAIHSYIPQIVMSDEFIAKIKASAFSGNLTAQKLITISKILPPEAITQDELIQFITNLMDNNVIDAYITQYYQSFYQMDDQEDGIQYLEKAIALNSGEAMLLLSHLHLKSDPTSAEFRQSIETFEKICLTINDAMPENILLNDKYLCVFDTDNPEIYGIDFDKVPEDLKALVWRITGYDFNGQFSPLEDAAVEVDETEE